ncbi:hypothetical protein M9Y10_021772 [Tritrichomonas musculus]|uniref:Uncharacterized protein n=1 Tax=Tritrichomonas musculus TaxID=1915356 RepID=A0ABR2GK59_9EUKA
MSREIIDLTQNSDSDEDEKIIKVPIAEEPIDVSNQKTISRSESTDFPQTMIFTPYPGSINDPLGMPLIDTAHSIAYTFSSSNIDPFSNLIRLLHQNLNDGNSLFNQITQSLAFNAKPVEFFPLLLQLINYKQNHPAFLRHLAIKSVIALSVNNPELCRAVLDNVKFFIEISKENNDEFLDDVLQLYQVVCDYATNNDALAIISDISSRKLIHHLISDEEKKAFPSVHDPIRVKVYSILALLAHYGDAFTDSIVDEIIKKSNFPGKGHLSRQIMWPAIVCIDQFLKQPNTRAYKKLQDSKEMLYAKLGLDVIACEKDKDDELRILVLKIFLEILDEFYEESINPFFLFQIETSLISMKHFASEPVRQMAEVLLKRLKVEMN